MFDTIISGGRYIDGTGAPSSLKNIAIKDGVIVKVTSQEMSADEAKTFVDATGKWVTPGFIDTHTHYDAELLVSPSLSESVRHGVTTILVGSCSLSMVCSDCEDASDIFTRVETVPRDRVLPILKQNKTWSRPKEWVDYVSELPLGPNVISLIGHSDIRTAVMGLSRATDPDIVPTEPEMLQMEALLTESLECGFLGLSTMRLTWDKVDGDREWSKSLPSTYAKWREIARLTKLLRKYGRVHQGAPNAATPLRIFDYIKESIGFFRKPLKTTLISRMDLKGSPYINFLTKLASFTANSLKGNFRWQVLPTPFTVYADGIDVVFFEEFGAGELALDLKTKVERDELLKDEHYRRDFRKFYGEKLSPRVWQRDFGDAIILACPDNTLEGRDFESVANERGIHVVDLFLDLVVEFGKDLRWYTTVANHRPDVLKKLIKDKDSLITFSDAGAHIRNMAFYNLPLRLLKLAQQSKSDEFMSIEQAVWRVTGDQADWFGVDAGKIREGDRADVVVINPEGLAQDLEAVCWAEMENFDLSRLVNRNPGIIEHVWINGKHAVDNEEIANSLGREKGFGRFVPAKKP
ncbi:N-acyl-D-glutamate amidohydrolase [Alteromonas sediminis]|uniref:N-acyl-D-glutamate amidohydrolase n=1 Tax=Alteromonas sediminis TaxID=2259342 RepID=A0A3N5Y0K8_9ALTE|nr:amidohydrolase family protein [Alteromonas sediminis]RPJ67227.1 N-acyl-D-glutamate amidohydrolase [Alteromonas sediminis]